LNILQELDKVEREIERSTREKNQAEGKIEAKIEALKKQFGIAPKEVDKKVKRMELDLKDLGVEIETQFKELKEKYSWE